LSPIDPPPGEQGQKIRHFAFGGSSSGLGSIWVKFGCRSTGGNAEGCRNLGRRSRWGQLTLTLGGIREIQEMLAFCGEHNITANVEDIPVQKVNEALKKHLTH